jgi:hypothetical protein
VESLSKLGTISKVSKQVKTLDHSTTHQMENSIQDSITDFTGGGKVFDT